MASDILGVPNVMLYTSYPSNGSYSAAASFEGVSGEHSLRIAADQIAADYAARYGCICKINC